VTVHVLGRAITEKEWQTQVVQLARLYGWRLIYHTYDSRRSPSGFPDLVLVRDERLVFVELKAGRGRVSPAQREWLAGLQRTAAEVYVWRPDDVDEVLRVLAR
jgi:hypothetical protein